MQSPQASAFRQINRPFLIGFAASIGLAFIGPLTGTAMAAGGLVTATLLENYAKPTSVVIDLMDDSLDSQTIAHNIKHALAAQGIPTVEDGDIVLEVNVSASADSSTGSRSSRADAERRDVTTRDDQLSQLAPTRELSPDAGQGKVRRAAGASIDLTMMLYKRGKPAMWRADGSADRDIRSLADQGSALAIKALGFLGKNGTATVD